MNKTENKTNYKKKLSLLKDVKKIVRKDGWSRNLLKKLINSKIKSSDLIYLFPNGYVDILDITLDEINKSLEKRIKKTNIINLSLTKRIKKILSTRLDILDEDKIFYKKTFYHLLLPNNSKIMKKKLYNSVDTMWYLAGDHSTDFSFYSKRLTLAAIYTNALFVFYNQDIEKAGSSIDKNLERISKIPRIKEKFSFLKDNLPLFIKGIIN